MFVESPEIDSRFLRPVEYRPTLELNRPLGETAHSVPLDHNSQHIVVDVAKGLRYNAPHMAVDFEVTPYSDENSAVFGRSELIALAVKDPTTLGVAYGAFLDNPDQNSVAARRLLLGLATDWGPAPQHSPEVELVVPGSLPYTVPLFQQYPFFHSKVAPLQFVAGRGVLP